MITPAPDLPRTSASSTTPALRCVDPLDIPDWDERVLAFPEADIFHSAAWARVLHEAYGYRPMYVVAEGPEAWLGVLPLMEVRSRLTGNRGVSLPFTDFCPALADSPEVSDQLVAEARRLGQERGWKYLEVRGLECSGVSVQCSGVSPSALRQDFGEPSRGAQGRQLRAGSSGQGVQVSGKGEGLYATDHSVMRSTQGCVPPEHRTLNTRLRQRQARPWQAEHSTRHYLEHTLNLDHAGHKPSLTDSPPPPEHRTLNTEHYFSLLSPSTRRAIRKAEKSGLEITRDSALGSVKAFCRLNEMTRRRHGLPPQPFTFFRLLHREILSKGHGCVVTARFRDQPVAAAVFLCFGNRAVFKYGASDPEYVGLRGNNLVMWEGIRACTESGSKRLSLGKTREENTGLRRFKLGWGAEEHVRDYHRFAGAEGEAAEWDDAVEGWHNAIFRRLPLSLSRMAGRVLYRHVG